MVEIVTALDKHLIPDLANIVLDYYQLEHVDKVIDDDYRVVYTKLFGKLHGEFKCYFATGELGSSRHYVNGKQHGESKYYHSTGETYCSEHYLNGKLHGEHKMYSATGELLYSEHYVDGVEQ